MPLLAAAWLLAAATSDFTREGLAQSAHGRIECHDPNLQTHTCRSMETYRPLGGDRFENDSTVLVAPNPPIALRVLQTVELKDGAVCGRLTAESITQGTLWVAGAPVPSAKAAPILAKLVQAMTPMIGKTACSHYEKTGEDWVVKGEIEGVATPAPPVKAIFVRPEDGYSVAP